MKNITDDFNQDAPDGLKMTFHTGDSFWPWITYRDNIDSLTFKGIRDGIVFSLLASTAASRSIVVGLITTFCISFVMFGVLSHVQHMGWEIGIMEQAALFLMLGLTTDYVMQVCYNFSQSLFNNKMERMHFAIRQIGSTIMGCALGTFLSGLFLVPCQADFLYKFGKLMISTILRSLGVVLIFLPAVLYIMGPNRQGNQSIYKSVLSKS